MFDKNFYPTPEHLIKKMLQDFTTEHGGNKYYTLTDKIILEPSAGKGDIINFINNNTRQNVDISAIEKNPDLKAVLLNNDIDVIAEDFLTFETDLHFDLIIMNPPFSNGTDHLLKAWEILKDGDIVCLLNAETILNTSDKKRKLLKNIIEENGSYEIIENGFSDSERKTNVKIALIKLTKEDNTFSENFDFKGFNNSIDDFDFKENINELTPAINDVFQTYVNQYKSCKKLFKEFLIAYHNLKQGLAIFKGSDNRHGNIDFCKIAQKKPKKAYKYFDKSLKILGWNTVFKKTKLSNKLSSKVVEDFNTFQRQQNNMNFDKENIFNLLEMLFLNQNLLREQNINYVWELLCSYDKKNKIHFEGWKTNDSFKVNSKVIIPNLIRYGEYTSASSLKDFGSTFNINYHNKLHDIDLVLCMLSGQEITQIETLENTFSKHFNTLGHIKTGDNFQNNIESEFFKIRFYKKGTAHLTFKNKQLLNFLNLEYAKGKNWLPDDYNEREKREKATEPVQEPKQKTHYKKRKRNVNISQNLKSLFDLE